VREQSSATSWCNKRPRVCKTRRATVVIKFVVGRKERFTGNDVHVGTWLIMIPIPIGTRTFSTVLQRDPKLFARKARYSVSIFCVFGHATSSLITNPLLNVVVMHCYWCSSSFLAHLPMMCPYKSEATPILCGGQSYNFLEHVTKCAVIPVSDHGCDLFYGMS
jgi:hypothetical protein